MRLDNPPSRRVMAPLTDRVGALATAQQSAAAFGALWSALEAALVPIIGPRGVEALGQRSVRLVSPLHPWLAADAPAGLALYGPLRLASLLAQRSPQEALAAGNAFLQTFDGLLASLIGPSLTDRLLQPVWDSTALPHLNSPAGQDSTP